MARTARNIFWLCLLLTGCGQTGPLYLPETPQELSLSLQQSTQP